MRAVVVQDQGGPEVPQLVELPEPSPGAVSCRSTSAPRVSFLDIQQRSGVRMRTPFTAGNAGAGVVSAVGADVDGIAGSRTLARPVASWLYCRTTA
jgi:NADPH:quinone reductase